jgi:hypothetical protein
MPLEVLRRIITSCSKPGDVVFDPFAGSGTTLVAAAQLGRRLIGTELSEQYAAQATARIEEEGARPYEPEPKPVVRPWRKRAGARRAKSKNGIDTVPLFGDNDEGPATATGT